MDIPFYSNLLDNYKTIKTVDKLDPPKVSQSKNINTKSEYVSDIVFTTGLIFFFHLSLKTVINIGSLSLKLLTDNFISNYYRNKTRRNLENYIRKEFVKSCNERVFELNHESLNVETINLKHQDYITYRNNSDIISLQDINELDKEFINIENDLYFTSNRCPCRWNDIIMMENDIINIVKDLYNARDDILGSLSTNINDANLSVCLSYLPKIRPSDVKYEVIAATSVHPSFIYVANILNIELKFIDIDNYSGKSLSKKISSLINYRTLFVIASAPTLSHGIIDNIAQLSEITLSHRIGLHIDCLSDNFILPFLKLNGSIVSNFDFTIKGVTSLSTNLSIDSNVTKSMQCILYKKKYGKNQKIVINSKLYGITPYSNYSYPIQGNTIAYYWYYLQLNGINNFIRKANNVVDLKKYLVKELGGLNSYSIIGEPFLGRVSIKVEKTSKLELAQHLFNYNWNIDIINHPDAISISIINNFIDESDIDKFIGNLSLFKPPDIKKKPIQSANIFGIKKIIKNVNPSVLLGEIFMDTLDNI